MTSSYDDVVEQAAKWGELSVLLNSHERCASCKGAWFQCIINALANHFSITYVLWQDLKVSTHHHYVHHNQQSFYCGLARLLSTRTLSPPPPTGCYGLFIAILKTDVCSTIRPFFFATQTSCTKGRAKKNKR